MHRLDVLPDPRDGAERRQALREARDTEVARERLGVVIEHLSAAVARAQAGDTGPPFWETLEEAFRALDAYLAGLVEQAGLRVRCRAGCSACCTDVPPTFPVEGLRLVRGLRGLADGPARIQRAVENARRFQKLLLQNGPAETAGDISSAHYRGTQLQFRALGYPCPVLDDHGNCGAYESRPLACRTHVHVLDPALCVPSHPGFLEAERPPLWGDLREAEVEKRLVEIGRALGLPATPNLPWAVAALHEHPLAG